MGNITGGHMKKIDPEAIDRYINIYKMKQPIANQPQFWEAVKMLAQDPKSKVTDLLNEEEPFIIDLNGSSLKHFKNAFPHCKTVKDVALKFAKEIRMYEDENLQGYLLFQLKMEIEDLKGRVEYRRKRHK